MIFLHIHRTGGSTVWHTIADAASKQGVRAIDLYGESSLAFDTPFLTFKTLQKIQSDEPALPWNVTSPLLRLHTRQNIERALPVGTRQYATVLRDPVDRFISEVFHVRKLLVQHAPFSEGVPIFSGEHSWYAKVFGDSLYTLFLQPDIDPNVLVLEASRCEYYKDFYFNFFWSVLQNDSTSEYPEYFAGEIDDNSRLLLVNEIKRKFCYVGACPDLKRAVSSIGTLLDIAINTEAELLHVRNGSEKPLLLSSTIEQLKIANADEYKFLAMLEMPFPIVDALNRSAELRLHHKALSEQLEQERALKAQAEKALDHVKVETGALAGDFLHQIQDIRSDLHASRQHNAALGLELIMSKRRMEGLLKSSSWRITAPVRKIKSFLVGHSATPVEITAKSQEIPAQPQVVARVLHEATLPHGSASIAVVMPTFNSARYLAESIESILEQTWTDFELAILDGGSTDATIEIAKAYAVRDARISIRVYQDVHPTFRVDDFFRVTQARWIALQHSDDISYTNRLERQIAAFLEDPDLAVSSAMYRSFWHVRDHGSETEGHHIHIKPHSHEEIKANLPFWWVMHASTLCFDREKALSVDLRFNNKYKFSNDYWVTVTNIDRLRYLNIQEELSAGRIHWRSDGNSNHDCISDEVLNLKEELLRYFGFTFTEEELKIHCGIDLLPEAKLRGAAQNHEATLAWLASLRQQNRQSRRLDVRVFDALIDRLMVQTRALQAQNQS